MWLGMLISTGGILASGFVTHPWQLILTQGVMYATGGSESIHLSADLSHALTVYLDSSLPLLPSHLVHVSVPLLSPSSPPSET